LGFFAAGFLAIPVYCLGAGYANQEVLLGVNMELAHLLWKAQGPELDKIILLHGMGGTGALWRPIAASLEEHYSVLAPDQRGHGKSQISQVSGGRSRVLYTPLEYGRDVRDTMEATGFHPAWVIGHSMGVRTACALAHLEPGWAKGLVLIDLGFSGVAGGGLGEGLAAFLKKLPMHFESRTAARDFMARECPDPSIAQYLMAVSAPAPQGGITFPFDQAALIETIYAARDASVREWVREMGQLGKPVLVLRGATSQVWSQAEFEAEKASFSKYPSVQFEEFPGTGHGLPFEKRVDFLARLRQFIT
jgi:pimeloyl-ACP methyl ester carboxylesterase